MMTAKQLQRRRDYQRHRERYLARSVAWDKAHPERVLARQRSKKLGRRFTATDFDALFLSQGSCCAICQSTSSGAVGWCLDHEHGTSNVRGILCSHCNRGLGQFRDDPDRLEAAIDYLRRATR